MALSPGQAQLGADLGSAVTQLQSALDQCNRSLTDLQQRGATVLAADLQAAITPLSQATDVLKKDLAVFNDINNTP